MNLDHTRHFGVTVSRKQQNSHYRCKVKKILLPRMLAKPIAHHIIYTDAQYAKMRAHQNKKLNVQTKKFVIQSNFPSENMKVKSFQRKAALIL